MKSMLLGAALLAAVAATAASTVNNATDSVAAKPEQAAKPAKVNPIDTLVVTTDPQMHCSSCETVSSKTSVLSKEQSTLPPTSKTKP